MGTITLKDTVIPTGGKTSFIPDITPGYYQNAQGGLEQLQTGILYYSSNNDIAMVDSDGTVHAIKAGKVQIHAELLEGTSAVLLPAVESYHVLIIDRSQYMGTDAMLDAKNVAIQYCQAVLKQHPSDKLAIVVAGDISSTKAICSWTNDLNMLQNAITSISAGGTVLYSAAFKEAQVLISSVSSTKTNINKNIVVFGCGIDDPGDVDYAKMILDSSNKDNALNMYAFAFYSGTLSSTSRVAGQSFLRSLTQIQWIDSSNRAATQDFYFEGLDSSAMSHALNMIANRPVVQNNIADSYITSYDINVYEDTQKTKISLGDVNNDGSINAEDANAILIAAARLGTGKASGLTAELEKAADVNNDGVLNAKDATSVLRYAAAVGTGQKVSIEDFA